MKERMTAVSIAEGFVASWACVRACQLHGMSIIGVIWFILISYFIIHVKQNREEKIEQKKRLIFAVLAFLLDALYVMAERAALTAGLENKLFHAAILIVCFAGFFILLYYLFMFLSGLIDKVKKEQPGTVKKNMKS